MNKIFIFLLFLISLPSIILAAGKVDINSATLSQLDELTGIGPKYAQAIIDNRPYSSVDDLLKVKGIGPATLQKIKDQGVACVDCSTVIPGLTRNPESTTQTLDSGLRQNDTSAPTITYPTGIFINELLPNPAGSDSEDEWVEIFNSNDSDVDLSGWKLQDVNGTVTNFTIPKNTEILANNFLVFKRTNSKIMLNNDSDGINLLSPDSKIQDSVNFTKAPLGQSFNKINSEWKWSTTLTPGAKNIIAAVATKALSKTKNSVKNNNINVKLADISQPIINENQNNKSSNPWLLFILALSSAIILAAITLFIKLKILK